MTNIRSLEKECKALGQKRRIQILALLKQEGGLSVGVIAQHLRCKFPTASQHIRILKEAGIVLDRKREKFVVYVLSPHMGKIAQMLIREL